MLSMMVIQHQKASLVATVQNKNFHHRSLYHAKYICAILQSRPSLYSFELPFIFCGVILCCIVHFRREDIMQSRFCIFAIFICGSCQWCTITLHLFVTIMLVMNNLRYIIVLELRWWRKFYICSVFNKFHLPLPLACLVEAPIRSDCCPIQKQFIVFLILTFQMTQKSEHGVALDVSYHLQVSAQTTQFSVFVVTSQDLGSTAQSERAMRGFLSLGMASSVILLGFELVAFDALSNVGSVVSRNKKVLLPYVEATQIQCSC